MHYRKFNCPRNKRATKWTDWKVRNLFNSLANSSYEEVLLTDVVLLSLHHIA